jgi:uncharacterized BrkB/YihY/UPF0761 family membrane protein
MSYTRAVLHQRRELRRQVYRRRLRTILTVFVATAVLVFLLSVT